VPPEVKQTGPKYKKKKKKFHAGFDDGFQAEAEWYCSSILTPL
jgi:hypothetical protein